MENENARSTMKDIGRYPTLLGSNLVYLVVLLLMVTFMIVNQSLGLFDQSSADYYYITILMTLVIVGLPGLVYLLINRMKIKQVVRLHKLGVGEFFLVVGMAVVGYAAINAVSLIWYWLIGHIGPPQPQELPPIRNGSEYLLAVVAAAVTPALVEEFLFRGVILRGYERLGRTLSVVMTGVLFGFLHLSVATIPAIILLGIMITYVVHRTNSLWAGVTYHFIHNLISISLLFLQTLLQNLLGGEAMVNDLSQIPPETLKIAISFWGAVGFFALLFFALFFTIFTRITQGKAQIRVPSEREHRRPRWLAMLPAIIGGLIIAALLAMEIQYMISLKA